MNSTMNKHNNTALNDQTHTFQAVVANITNKQCQIVMDNKIMPCLIPGALMSHRNALAVGDEVEVGQADNEQYKLIGVMPRETALYRGDRRAPAEEILIAANVQYLLAVASADYLINQAGYFEAAVIAAKRAGIGVGLFVSKADLIGESASRLLETKLALYRNIADAVYFGASHEINEEMIEWVKGKTTVVTGDRGCGKTTVIRGILNGLNAVTVKQEKEQSTHASVLHVGPEGTRLIDTPGFRSFSLQRITEDERRSVFPDIAGLADGCRFRSCTHVYEEGCEVIEALRANRITRERYDAYQTMAQIAPESKSIERRVPKVDYRHTACTESFVCKACGELVVPEGAGSRHRNHCPKCLSSVHVDIRPGDRASLCGGIMDPVSVWVRKDGEWAVIHRCRLCGGLSSNRVAADDNPMLLLSIAVKPLSSPPFPLNNLASLK